MAEWHSIDEPTTIAAYTEAIVRALELKGVDPLEVLREADVERVRSNDPMLRITDTNINAIFERAVAITGDPCFGLRVSECFVPGMLHALGYALLASETLEDFCLRLARYYAVVSQTATMQVIVEGDELLLLGTLRNPALCDESIDVWAGVMLRFMRAIHSEAFRPRLLELRRALPDAGAEPWESFFGCPVRFGSQRIGVHIDLATARVPLAGASRDMAQHNDQIAMAYLQKLDRDDIVTRVRALLINGLNVGAFGRAEIASRMHMSASTLQARLARRGVSFQHVLDSTRHELALGYLAQRRLSVTEIAFMLGFSDVSNFNRAFRRWTGMAPSEFRDTAPR
jgi:AraC-like DNA-binding protein